MTLPLPTCAICCTRRGNLALKISVDTGKPVRVLRGYKLKSPFAPESGYRYDGLYKVFAALRSHPVSSRLTTCCDLSAAIKQVVKYWLGPGLSGFNTFKFVFQRLPDQEPAPWTNADVTAAAAATD